MKSKKRIKLLNMAFDQLAFQASWRDYQVRVLRQLNYHLNDKHLHVVAAPGSGKTILGLEVMRRMGKPTIILAPTITIRNQWIDRLISMFLPMGEPYPDWISKDIRNPKFLTVISYQALHAAFSSEEEVEEEILHTKEANSEATRGVKLKKLKTVDIISRLAQLNVDTMVLDEAHHLRKEWWKALIRLKTGLDNPTIVSLTATPPYDVHYSEWQKYEELCGPIDAEISVAELVKRGDLCPHQDYIYFSLPSKKEMDRLSQFKADMVKFLEELQGNSAFLDAISSHPWVKDTNKHVEDILSEPKFFSSIIIFLNSAGIKLPRNALNVLGVDRKGIPDLTPEWLETILTGVLYTYVEYFKEYQETLNLIKKELKRIGALERRKVKIDNPKEIQKILERSLGKLDSIVDITRMEAEKLGNDLRMVILTDYIRKAELPSNADDFRPIDKIGVVPIFEYLRRANIQGVNLGVLTGSLIFIPKQAKSFLDHAVNDFQIDTSHIHYSDVAYDVNYLQVKIKGEQRQKIVQLVTEVFNAGGIHLLVGTQALLGEGWDAPSINTLILASNVGSYMLSNQMRGRAIRIDPNRPEKIANIRHLAAVDIETIEEKLILYLTANTFIHMDYDPFDEIKEALGSDVLMLRRRFRSFEGVSYEAPLLIENGFKRLGLSKIEWDITGVKQLNQSMLQRAKKREKLPKLWEEALIGKSPKPEMREKVQSNYVPKGLAFADTLKYLVMNALLCGGAWFFQMMMGPSKWSKEIVILLIVGVGLVVINIFKKLLKALYLLFRNGTLENSMKQVGLAVLETLEHMNLIKTSLRNIRILTTKDKLGIVYCRIEGATAVERRLFIEAMENVLGVTEKPRFLLVRESKLGRVLRVDYHPVPTVIGQKKKNAEFFSKCWNRYVGNVELVFTRSAEGRRTLLKARTRSLASAFKKKTDRISIWE